MNASCFCRPLLLFVSWLLLPATALAQLPRIDPAGIEGALLLCGRGEVSPAALDKFFDLAGGAGAKTVVFTTSMTIPDKAVLAQIKAGAEAKKISLPEVIELSPDKKTPNLGDILGTATGVWLVGESSKSWQQALSQTPLEKDCLGVLKRSGVIAASGGGAEMVAHAQLVARKLSKRGLGLLPDSILEVRGLEDKGFDLETGQFPNLVGYALAPGSAMLVKGRTISAVGDEPVTIFLTPSSTLPLRQNKLRGKREEDLTALRYAARDRAQNYPPAKTELPIVEKGTLVIVGGGGSPEGLHKKFVELAGGKDKANIVIFPTANPEPTAKKDLVPKKDILAQLFRNAGAKKVTVLKGRTLAEVESKEFLDTLREATGLWFDGGRQWRYVDCYENTRAIPLMFDVLKRGGVIGGTSAGATIQGDYLCRGGVFDNFDIRYEGYERGLGFLKGVAIDQHFTQRKRHADMTSLMKTYPQYLGIGLDEATAIVVQGSTAEVIGRGKVHFYDARRKAEKGQDDYEALTAGNRYDLKARKILASP